MGNYNRTGRVSSINYEEGTFEVTYRDRGQSVTQKINAVSNGEYKMPNIGQVVSVIHNSNGTTAACSMGTIWNATNRPAEGFKGLFRKEYGSRPGEAFTRYDENTGIFTLTVGNVTITIDGAGAVHLDTGGDIIINGVSLSTHTHSGGGGGQPNRREEE